MAEIERGREIGSDRLDIRGDAEKFKGLNRELLL